MISFQPQVNLTAPCKCCESAAELWGVVDFHKNCEEQRQRKVLPLSGIPIYYYRCPACGFIFTTAFDDLSHEQFKKFIYNDQYVLVDPDYLAPRPGSTQAAAELLKENRSLRILDYGSGSGKFVEHLRGLGYHDAHCYDPFEPGSAAQPQGKFECIFCFEVLEHTPTPRLTVGDMLSLLKQPGMLVFSTVLQPAPVDIGWWYIAPRNGHVSIYNDKSLHQLAKSVGYQFASFSNNLHVLFKEVPDFAKPWFPT